MRNNLGRDWKRVFLDGGIWWLFMAQSNILKANEPRSA